MRLPIVYNILTYRYLIESLLNVKLSFLMLVQMIWPSDKYLAHIFKCRKFVEN